MGFRGRRNHRFESPEQQSWGKTLLEVPQFYKQENRPQKVGAYPEITQVWQIQPWEMTAVSATLFSTN